MLETDSEQWVRVLLQSSKASEALQGFAAAVEQMDVRRRAAAESVREQQAFIAVLQVTLPLPLPLPLPLTLHRGAAGGAGARGLAVLQVGPGSGGGGVG